MTPPDAETAARLLHALHLAAQMRAPGGIADFSRGPVRRLLELFAIERTGRESGRS